MLLVSVSVVEGEDKALGGPRAATIPFVGVVLGLGRMVGEKNTLPPEASTLSYPIVALDHCDDVNVVGKRLAVAELLVGVGCVLSVPVAGLLVRGGFRMVLGIVGGEVVGELVASARLLDGDRLNVCMGAFVELSRLLVGAKLFSACLVLDESVGVHVLCVIVGDVWVQAVAVAKFLFGVGLGDPAGHHL